MPLVFDVNDADARRQLLGRLLPEAVDRLREDATPQWGVMTAQQMVEHLIWTLELSRGGAPVKCFAPADMRERPKPFLYDNRPTPRCFKNPALGDGPLPLRYSGLPEAKAEFRKELERYLGYQRDHPEALNTHPLLGPLGTEEWERCHYKHSYHHLLQFGLV